MDFETITFIGGYTVPRPPELDNLTTPSERMACMERAGYVYKNTHRAGAWRVETARKVAQKMGFVGNFRLQIERLDRSGKGRSYILSSESYPVEE